MLTESTPIGRERAKGLGRVAAQDISNAPENKEALVSAAKKKGRAAVADDPAGYATEIKQRALKNRLKSQKRRVAPLPLEDRPSWRPR